MNSVGSGIDDQGISQIAPPTLRRYSIRASLFALMAVCLTPSLLVSGYLAYDNYKQQRARVERDVLLQARSLAADLDRELSGVASGLRLLSTSPSLTAGDLRGFHERAHDALAFQAVDHYVLADRQGRQFVNTLRPFGTPLPPSAAAGELQGVFQRGQPVLSGLFTAPVTGRYAIALGVPVFSEEKILYTLNAGLEPARIGDILRRQAIPEHWIAAVLDGSGTVVARSRDSARFVGKKGTPDLLAQLRSTRADGVFMSRSLDGIPTYLGFARSTVSDWSLVVGAPRTTVEAGLTWSLSWVAASAALAFAVGIWIALRLSRMVISSIQGLVGPALSLGHGHPVKLTPQTWLKEADAVSQALVQAGHMLAQTRHQAHHDVLTGLPNRLLFEELAASRLAEARRHGTCFAVLAIDLDGFKAVNDTHGHAAGDLVLKLAAARISEVLRESDVVARMGGDEFAVLLGEAGHDDAEHVTRKLIDRISAPYPGMQPAVSASVGIALYPQAGATVADLCEHADHALYEAKRTGKGRLAVYA